MKKFFDWKRRYKYQIIINILITEKVFSQARFASYGTQLFFCCNPDIRSEQSKISDRIVIVTKLRSKNYAEIGIFIDDNLEKVQKC